MALTAVNDDTTIIRRARKEHACVCLCGNGINAGDEYAEYVAMAEGPYASGWRYCSTCAVNEGLASAEPPKDTRQ